MKRFLVAIAVSLALVGAADAKGGFSSGGARSAGGFSGSRGSFSSAPRPSPSFSSPSVPRPQVQAPRTSTTTTVTTSRSSSYGGRYVSPGGYYGGWGMGYGYSNGLLTGMIIANMMHPYGTVMYAGPGMYANNALLYPNGMVVNQQGYQVGTYANGSFSPVNGGMVAQQVPADATQPAAAPVVVNTGPSVWDIVSIAAMVVLGIFCIILLVAILM